MSNDPQDYGMKRYSDLEIAEHSILIEGLPKDVPREDLERRIKNMFSQVIGGAKFKSRSLRTAAAN